MSDKTVCECCVSLIRLLWRVAPKTFSVRMLFVGVTLVAVMLGMVIRAGDRQRKIVERILQLGGFVDYRTYEDGEPVLTAAPPTTGFAFFLGRDAVFRVESISVCSCVPEYLDEAIRLGHELPYIRSIYVDRSNLEMLQKARLLCITHPRLIIADGTRYMDCSGAEIPNDEAIRRIRGQE